VIISSDRSQLRWPVVLLTALALVVAGAVAVVVRTANAAAVAAR